MRRKLCNLIQDYITYLQLRLLSKCTQTRYILELKRLARFCFKCDIESIVDFDCDFISSYVRYLYSLDLSVKSMKMSIIVLKGLLNYADDCGYILFNPFAKISVILKGKEKERKVFSESEVSKFLNSIVMDNFIHSRDKAIFELMYGSGLRVNETVQLNISDIDLDHHEIVILHGKGNKQRIVPLYGKAYFCINYWLKYYRIRKQTVNALFISNQGNRINRKVIERNFKKYLKKINLEDKGYVPHSLRHSCASHLLSHGADIRFIQDLLGHESIETTSIYTKQEKSKLKKVHKMYHPRENELFE